MNYTHNSIPTDRAYDFDAFCGGAFEAVYKIISVSTDDEPIEYMALVGLELTNDAKTCLIDIFARFFMTNLADLTELATGFAVIDWEEVGCSFVVDVERAGDGLRALYMKVPADEAGLVRNLGNKLADLASKVGEINLYMDADTGGKVNVDRAIG